MKQSLLIAPALAVALAITLPPAPLRAGGLFDDLPEIGELEDAARDALRLLQRDIEPYVEEFRSEIGDAFDQLNSYEAPRSLPNGDILIPRRRPAPPPPAVETPETVDI